MSSKKRAFKVGDKIIVKEYKSWGECEITKIKERPSGELRYDIRISPCGMWYNVLGTALQRVRKHKRGRQKSGNDK